MDRNSIIGIILIAAILIVWSVIFGPSKKEMEAINRQRDSIARVEQQNITEQKLVEQMTDSMINQAIRDTSSIAVSRQYGEFSDAAAGKQEFVTLENDLLKLTISTLGGRPYSVELKNYKTHTQNPVVLFNGDSTEFGLYFYSQNNTISTNNLFFVPKHDRKSVMVQDRADSLTMKLQVNEKKYIEFVYSVQPGSYMVNFRINLVGMKDIGTRSPEILDMKWAYYVPQQEQLKKNENQYTTIYYKPLDEKVSFLKARSNKTEQRLDFPTSIEWIAYKDQFFSSVLIPSSGFDNALIRSISLPEADKYLRHFSTEFGLPFKRHDSESITMRMYYGPNKFKVLNQYKDLELQNLVTLGNNIIRWINRFLIIPIFDWLSLFIGNYGLIILLLTIIIKIGLLPLTYRSYLSQAKMRVLKPQMDELNLKFPKGKEMEKQQATMALYKKAGVSPLGGCLPMLLQFPILFAMFRFFPTSIELRQEGFLWAKDLSTYDAILSWSAHIPIISNIYGNHISLWTLLMTISTIISMKMGEGQTTSQQMPGMKTMMYIMPIMFMFILNNFSAGLTYYYFLTNIITIGQNFLFKQFVNEEELLKKIEARKVKPVQKSKFQQRLEEMAKQQQGYRTGKKK